MKKTIFIFLSLIIMVFIVKYFEIENNFWIMYWSIITQNQVVYKNKKCYSVCSQKFQKKLKVDVPIFSKNKSLCIPKLRATKILYL